MRKRRSNSNRASTLWIALLTGLISGSAILFVITVSVNAKKAPYPYGFELNENAEGNTTLGNYPNTSVLLSGNTMVTPDAAPQLQGLVCRQPNDGRRHGD